MTKEKELAIHNTLYKYCSDFIPVQEITHAANEIIKDPTEDTVLKMTTYLDSFDTMFNGGQQQLQPTVTIQSLTANNVRFAMSEIRNIIK